MIGNKTTKINKGFTLVETLIAISILLVAIAGPLTIASRGLVASKYSRDQVIAFYLAQEATEFIRNKRDNNAITGNLWTDGLGPCFNPNGCMVDATGGVFSSCTGDGCVELNIHKTTGFYSYSNGTDWRGSGFTRTINIEQINPDEIKITVGVSWRTGTLNKSFSINENLFDWQ